MFEQSVVEARGLAARPWTLAASLTMQMALVSAAIVVPMLNPEVLQKVSVYIPVVGPPRAHHAPTSQRTEVARAVATPRVFRPGAIISPASMPEHVRMLQDDVPVAIGGPGAGLDNGVVGGLDSSYVDRIITGISKPIAEPARQAVQAPPKALPKPQAEPAKVPVGGDVQAALLIHGPKPVYPALARQARVQGTVHLAAVIGTDGRVLDLRARDGHPLLVGAALDAVKHWIYKPTLLNGAPVEVVTEITVTFTLQ